MSKKIISAFHEKNVILLNVFKLVIIITIMSAVQAGAGNNLISNPGTEDGKNGLPLIWEKSSENNCIWDTEVRHTGEYSISVLNKQIQSESRSHNLWHQKIPLKGKESYVFSVWIKTKDVMEKDGRAGIDLWILDAKGKRLCFIGQSYGINRIHGNSDWQLYQKKFMAPDNAAFLEIYALMQKNTSGQIWFDDFSLLPSTEENSKFRQIFPFATEYDKKITDLTKSIVSSPRKINASYGTSVIDGNLTDDCWQKTQKIKDFVLAGRNEFANEETIVSICHDSTNLYIAFKSSTDDMSKLKAVFGKDEKNASLWYDDCVDIFIYSKEKKTTVHFIVNSNGAKWNGMHRDLAADTSWVPVWDVATAKDDKSWNAEIAIPLKELNPVLGEADNWVLNLCRENKTNGEHSSICFLPYSNRFLQPEYFANISFGKENGQKDTFHDEMTALHKLLDSRKEAVTAGSRNAEYVFKRAFDFGTGKSPLKNGFIKITPESIYSSDKGYGWVDNSSMAGLNRKADPVTESPNELTCDFIEGKRSSQFRMDLPDGEYTVYLICGDTNAPAPIFRIYSDDNELGEIKVGGRYNFQPFSFPVKVKDQRLLLTFKGDSGWLVNALIVFPDKDVINARKELDKIEREIYLGYLEYVIKYAKYEYNETNPLPEDVDNKGYLVFSRNYLDAVYTNTIPGKEGITKELSIFTTPGEYEPAVFSILPLKDLKNVRISVSDLIDSEGKTIDKSNIDIREVKNHYHNINLSMPSSYMLFPKVLDKFDGANIGNQKATTVWLTIKISEGIPAGNYRGEIKIEAENSESSVLDMNVKVFPFELLALKSPVFSMCYHLPLNCPARGIDGWKLVEKDLDDMKKHNMNSVNLFVISQNIWNELGEKQKSINTSGLLKFLELCKKAGLTEPVLLNIGPYFPWDPNQSNKKESINIQEWQYVIDAINELEKEVVSKNLPQIFWYVDEPATDVKKQNVSNFCRLLKKYCPSSKIFITYVTSFEEANIVSPNPFQIIDTLKHDPGYFDEQKRKNVSVWTYNAAVSPFCPELDRLATGFMMWHWNVEGQLNFTYQLYYYHKNPYNPLDNPNIAMYGHTYPGADGPISTTTWEAIREGVDDLRYIKTLEAYIALAKKSNSSASFKTVQNAEAYLRNLKSEISSIDWISCSKNEDFGISKALPPSDFFNFHRKKIAEFINELREGLNH